MIWEDLGVVRVNILVLMVTRETFFAIVMVYGLLYTQNPIKMVVHRNSRFSPLANYSCIIRLLYAYEADPKGVQQLEIK